MSVRRKLQKPTVFSLHRKEFLVNKQTNKKQHTYKKQQPSKHFTFGQALENYYDPVQQNHMQDVEQQLICS